MPKTDPLIEAARLSLSPYLYLVHDTDMPQIHGGKAMPQPHHVQMIDILVNDNYGHSLILAPRGAAKTKLLQASIEWRLGRASLGMDGFGRNWAKDFRVGYVCASASQAYGVSNAIKETIEANIYFQAMFPKVKKHKDKWSEPEWKVRGNSTKDSNFVAAGRGGPILGKRFHRLFFDDLAGEDERSSDLATATKPRRDLIFWIKNTAMKTLVPGGRVIQAATRWYEGDPPEWAMDTGHYVLMIKALTDCDESCEDSNDAGSMPAGGAVPPSPLENGRGEVAPHQTASSCPGEHSYWPERVSAAELIADRKIDPQSFALQMQNEIVPAVGQYFQREWFDKRFDHLPGPEQTRAVVATWDTAGTTTGRSYTAGLIIYITHDFNYYIKTLYRKKMPYHEVRNLIQWVANNEKVTHTLIEAKSTGQSALQELSYLKEQDPAGEGVYGLIDGILPPGQRGGPVADLEYVQQVTLPCETGRVWLPSTEYLKQNGMADWRDIFLKELIQFPEGQNDDTVMAFKQLIYKAERERFKFEVLARSRSVPALEYGRSVEQRAVI